MLSPGPRAIPNPARTHSTRNCQIDQESDCGAKIMCFELQALSVQMNPEPALWMGKTVLMKRIVPTGLGLSMVLGLAACAMPIPDDPGLEDVPVFDGKPPRPRPMPPTPGSMRKPSSPCWRMAAVPGLRWTG